VRVSEYAAAAAGHRSAGARTSGERGDARRLRADGFARFREIGSFIPFLFLVPAVLRWGFTDLFEHLGIAGLRLLLATLR
jgi:hypothetical protein